MLSHHCFGQTRGLIANSLVIEILQIKKINFNCDYLAKKAPNYQVKLLYLKVTTPKFLCAVQCVSTTAATATTATAATTSIATAAAATATTTATTTSTSTTTATTVATAATNCYHCD